MIGRKLILALAGLFALSFGCEKSSPVSAVPAANQAPPIQSQSVDSAIHIHWLGKKKIAADKNAAALMQIWDAPESAKLEAQTLDKLSSAPWKLPFGETNQASANLLRPLLDDAVAEESYIEICKSTNAPNENDELLFAIRLNDERANLWQTNLAAVFQSLTHIAPEYQNAHRWSLKKHHVPNLIEFVHAGEWVVLGAAQDHNALLEQTLARIERKQSPFSASPTNSWLEANIDFSRTANLRSRLNLPATFPSISMMITGDRQNVLTRGRVNFPEAISYVSESWKIPTNVIGTDLSSFTAMRAGVQKLLSPVWNKFETNPPPNQLYIWSNDGVPMESYFSAPYADSSNAVLKLSGFLLAKAESWKAPGEAVRFQRAKTFNGLEWKGIPFISPFVKSAEVSGQGYILGGLFPLVATDQGPVQPLDKGVFEQTNLVYYNWELTGSRLEQWTYIAQTLRFVAGRPQLPPDSPEMRWLNSMRKKLGRSSTEIVCNNEREFLFTRSSDVGFTAIELQFLIDWLQSSDFPAMEDYPSLLRPGKP